MGSLSKKGFKKINEGQWSVTYISGESLVKFLTNPVLCYCDKDVCDDDSKYDKKLCNMDVDVGIDCIIEIPGNYINTKNCYYMSTSANDPVFEKLLKVSEGKYLYYMDKDKHITDVKSEQENVIYWSPDCKYEKFKVCLGYIKVLSKILIMI
ncbi:hypothetical protein TpMuguga_01g00436 [Theileria parva strain Muguga]|uniref:Uncharacterized protein n=1 Tax=Theileria parva TaxID=5875 RepID=Q4N8M8_THEPA|nr:uncharacterized protein TpMuguga_01g00436 [Theileria parva strain Muguga]EAN33680.1 hypothetical protein TpMuguga_01g00436 [Theileria parva strain Muguga]|eukprot:XP_765963.1 hypothetical protein [Theileria parva strain Muguga]